MPYSAFLSYSRIDDRIANWLHSRLDRFRTPKVLIGVQGSHGPVIEKLHPIFRDRTDMSGGGELAFRIKEALQQSERLIVLCSPAAVESSWVDLEVEEFISSGRGDRIFPVIAPDLPDTADIETAFFPPSLRGRGIVAADLREIRLRNGKIVGDGRVAGLNKLLAGLLGIELDQLVKRERRRQRVLMAGISSAAVLFALAAAWAVLASLVATSRSEAALAQLYSATHAQLEIAARDIRSNLENHNADAALELATDAYAAIPLELKDTERRALARPIDMLWQQANNVSRLRGAYLDARGVELPAIFGNAQTFLTPGPFDRSIVARAYPSATVIGNIPIDWRSLLSSYQFSAGDLLVLMYEAEVNPSQVGTSTERASATARSKIVMETRRQADLHLVRRVEMSQPPLCVIENPSGPQSLHVDAEGQLFLVNLTTGQKQILGSAEQLRVSPQQFVRYEMLEAPFQDGETAAGPKRTLMLSTVLPSFACASRATEDALGLVTSWQIVDVPISPAEMPADARLVETVPLPQASVHLYRQGQWSELATLPICERTDGIRCRPYLASLRDDSNLVVYQAAPEIHPALMLNSQEPPVADALLISPSGSSMLAPSVIGVWPAPIGTSLVIARRDGLYLLDDGRTVRLGEIVPSTCPQIRLAWSALAERFAVSCLTKSEASGRSFTSTHVSVFVNPKGSRVGVRGVGNESQINPYWMFRVSNALLHHRGVRWPLDRGSLQSDVVWVGESLMVHGANDFRVYSNPDVADEFGQRSVQGVTASGELVLAAQDGRVAKFSPASGTVRRLVLPQSEQFAALDGVAQEIRDRIARAGSLNQGQINQLNADANAADMLFSSLQLTGGEVVGSRRPILLMGALDCTVTVADLLAWRAIGQFRPCSSDTLQPDSYGLKAGVVGDTLIFADAGEGYAAYSLSDNFRVLWRAPNARFAQVAEEAEQVWALENQAIVARDAHSGQLVKSIKPILSNLDAMAVSNDARSILIRSADSLAFLRMGNTSWFEEPKDVQLSTLLHDGGIAFSSGFPARLYTVDTMLRRKAFEMRTDGVIEFRPILGSNFTIFSRYGTRTGSDEISRREEVYRHGAGEIELVGTAERTDISPAALTFRDDGYYAIERGLFVFHPEKPAEHVARAALLQLRLPKSMSPEWSSFAYVGNAPSKRTLRVANAIVESRLAALVSYSGRLFSDGRPSETRPPADPLAGLIKALTDSNELHLTGVRSFLFNHPAAYLFGERLPTFPSTQHILSTPSLRKLSSEISSLERLAQSGDPIALYFAALIELAQANPRSASAQATERLVSACGAGIPEACLAAAIVGEYGALDDQVIGFAPDRGSPTTSKMLVRAATLGDPYAWAKIGDCYSAPKTSKICGSLNTQALALEFVSQNELGRAVEAYRMAEVLSAPEVFRAIGHLGLQEILLPARSARLNAAQSISNEVAVAIESSVRKRTGSMFEAGLE